MFRAFYSKRTEQKALVVLLGICFLIFLLITLLDAVSDRTPLSSEHSVWNKGWLLVDSNGNSDQVTLPKTMPYGKGSATLSRVLDDRVEQSDAVLRLCSDYENLSVTLDGKPIYSYSGKESSTSNVTGTTYHYLQLPENTKGKELIIHYTFQEGRSMVYEIKAPEYAKREAFLSRAVVASLPFTAIAVVVAMCGIVILLMTLRTQTNKTFSNTFWNIGVFALLFAVFLVSRLPYLPFVLVNPISRHFLTYVTLLTMPVPFVAMFFGETDEAYRKSQIIAVILVLVNTAVQVLLALLHVVDFRALLPITLALTVFSMITVLVGIYRSKNTEKEAPWINDTAVLVGIGAVVDLLLVLIGHPSYCSCVFFTIGVSLFLIARFSYFLYAFSGQFRTNVETMLLEEMAYKDMLTGISNRNAYELYMAEITARPPVDRMYGLIADINDLKYTNDTYGHEMGDTIIVTVSDILFHTFGKNSSCFRLGGDEFVAFIRGMSAEQMEQRIGDFKAALDDYNKGHTPAIRVALGYAETEPDDYRNMKAFLRRIDKMMYEDKRFSKALERAEKDPIAEGEEPPIESQVENSLAVSSLPDETDPAAEPAPTTQEASTEPSDESADENTDETAADEG